MADRRREVWALLHRKRAEHDRLVDLLDYALEFDEWAPHMSEDRVTAHAFAEAKRDGCAAVRADIARLDDEMAALRAEYAALPAPPSDGSSYWRLEYPKTVNFAIEDLGPCLLE